MKTRRRANRQGLAGKMDKRNISLGKGEEMLTRRRVEGQSNSYVSSLNALHARSCPLDRRRR